MPLAFTQEDFLVLNKLENIKLRSHVVKFGPIFSPNEFPMVLFTQDNNYI